MYNMYFKIRFTVYTGETEINDTYLLFIIDCGKII